MTRFICPDCRERLASEVPEHDCPAQETRGPREPREPRRSAAPDTAACSVGQVGDREWWCSTHRRSAEDCEQSPQEVTYQEALLEGADPYEPDYDPR